MTTGITPVTVTFLAKEIRGTNCQGRLRQRPALQPIPWCRLCRFEPIGSNACPSLWDTSRQSELTRQADECTGPVYPLNPKVGIRRVYRKNLGRFFELSIACGSALVRKRGQSTILDRFGARPTRLAWPLGWKSLGRDRRTDGRFRWRGNQTPLKMDSDLSRYPFNPSICRKSVKIC